MKKKVKIILGVAGGTVVAVALVAVYWVHHFQKYTPAEVKADIRAALAARNSPRRVERFLEVRYGPLTDPANRQRAFLDFFNPGHIQGLHLIVSHTPEEMKQANNLAMAQWIADYRRTMTSEERTALGSYFVSDAGHARLQQATALYLRQDAHYRAATAPVIRELLATVAAVQNP